MVYYARKLKHQPESVEDWPFSIEETVRAAVTSPRDFDYVMNNWSYAKTVLYYLMGLPDNS